MIETKPFLGTLGRKKRETPTLGQRVASFFGGLFGYEVEENSETENVHFKRDAPHPSQYKPTLGPVYHTPHSSPYHPVVHQVYHPATVSHPGSSYPQPKPVFHPRPVYHPELTYHQPKHAHHSQQEYRPDPVYHQPKPYHHIDYYHPPEPKFKLRIRTRRDFSCCADDSNSDLGVCTELKDECKEMMTTKKMFNGRMVDQMVDCKNTIRFT